jgi:ribosome-associated heat shock protein Hsp15
MEKVRVDKWLWAIRLYKSRTLASEACDGGKVKIDGNHLKASKMLSIGDVLHIRHNHSLKIYKVISLIEKRVNASLAAACFEDLSPPEDPSDFIPSAFAQRDKGMGRPTKKERRNIDDFSSWKD